MSSIKTIYHGTEVKIWHFNHHTRLDEAYMNGVIVYKRMLEFTIPQQSNTFNLRTLINNVNSLGANVIIVTNNSVQPTMHTGDLSGLEVTFINNGEIRGTNPSDTALVMSSPMKLINNGWIRGAGGNGGHGGHGGKGKNGNTAPGKKVSYTVTGSTWPTTNFNWSYGRHGHAVLTKNGWTMESRDGSVWVKSKPC